MHYTSGPWLDQFKTLDPTWNSFQFIILIWPNPLGPKNDLPCHLFWGGLMSQSCLFSSVLFSGPKPLSCDLANWIWWMHGLPVWPDMGKKDVLDLIDAIILDITWLIPCWLQNLVKFLFLSYIICRYKILFKSLWRSPHISSLAEITDLELQSAWSWCPIICNRCEIV